MLPGDAVNRFLRILPYALNSCEFRSRRTRQRARPPARPADSHVTSRCLGKTVRGNGPARRLRALLTLTEPVPVARMPAYL